MEQFELLLCMRFTELQVMVDTEQINESELNTMYTVFQYRPELMFYMNKNIIYHKQPDDYIQFVCKLNTKLRFISDFEFAFEA